MAVNNAINLTVTGVVTADGSGGFTGSALTDNTVVRGSTSNTLQDSTITVSDAGEMVNTSQPCFSAYLGTDDTNATGNGTNFTIGSGNALTELFDQGGNFVTTGIYTAPVSSKQVLVSIVSLDNLAVGHSDLSNRFVTSNNTFAGRVTNPYFVSSSTGVLTNKVLIICELDAADTVTTLVEVFGGTKTVTVVSSGSTINTVIGGELLC